MLISKHALVITADVVCFSFSSLYPRVMFVLGVYILRGFPEHGGHMLTVSRLIYTILRLLTFVFFFFLKKRENFIKLGLSIVNEQKNT